MKDKHAFRINAGGKAVFVYPKELREAGYVELPSIEEIGEQWDLADRFWNEAAQFDTEGIVSGYSYGEFISTWIYDWLNE